MLAGNVWEKRLTIAIHSGSREKWGEGVPFLCLFSLFFVGDAFDELLVRPSKDRR
jgi:hypothetical protein